MTFLGIQGQTIEIGDDAYKVKEWIQYTTKNSYGFDEVGNSKGNNVTWDAKYKNGEITDVVQCVTNQYSLDFKIPINFCDYYIMVSEKLVFIVKQFENVSLNNLKSNFDKLFKERRFGDYYFTEDYKYFYLLYLAPNGYASTRYGLVKYLPENIKIGIQQKINQIEEEINLQKQLQEKYNALITKADIQFQNKKWIASKKSYENALQLDIDNIYPNEKIEEIKKMLAFLTERKTKIYDYSEFDNPTYKDVNSQIIQNVKENISKNELTGNINATFSYQIDSLGKNNLSTKKDMNSDKILLNNISSTLKQSTFNKLIIKTYPVNSFADVSINLSSYVKDLSLKKSSKGIEIDGNFPQKYNTFLSSEFSNNPYGKYRITYFDRQINLQDFSSAKVKNFRGAGGPSNALLSILVPGLGDRYVSNGEKTGVGMMLWTYGLLATGVASKLYSNVQYTKYQQATNQIDIDKYYDDANATNKAFYVLVGAGASLWIYDVVWVLVKGSKNARIARDYKKSLTTFYNPIDKSIGINLKINF